MKILTSLLAIAAATIAAACQPANPDSGVAASSSARHSPFSIDPLGDNDWNIQGCQTMLSRVGAPANEGVLFAEDAVDNGAQGFIKINGVVINVSLSSATGSDVSPEVRTFEDQAHTVMVVESTTLGQAHEEADSVDRTGTLAVTFSGATQTLAVNGGTAC